MFSPKKLWQHWLHLFYTGLSRSWKGAAIALVLPLLALFAYLGFAARIGLHPILDAGMGLLAGVLLFFLTAALLDLVTGIAARTPRHFLVWSGAAAIMIFVVGHMLSNQLLAAILLTAAFLVVLGSLGWASAVLYRRPKVVGAWFVLFLALGCVAWGVHWIVQPGIGGSNYPKTDSSPSPYALENTTLVNPALPGSFATQTATYGSGLNQRRPEYRPEAVDWTSKSVDASAFLPDLSGWREKVRSWYWGFSKEAFPLNGLVWYPEGSGPFPLVLMVHGNHQMEEVSDPGYAYLGEFLASRGMIAVSVDQNFLNGSWTGSFGSENHVRAWLLLKHLAAWHEWNQSPDHPLQGRVDIANIGLIGHSRGGEAVALATAFNRLPMYPGDASISFDFQFNIRAVAAIAPSDGQYKPADQLVPLENFHYLTLQGSLDSDVSQFMGQSPYQRLQFTNDEYWTKTAVYLHGANHGQFNSVWSRYDLPPPLHWFLNTDPIIPERDQQRMAKFYLGAFFEASLQGNEDYFLFLKEPHYLNEFGLYPWVKGLFQDSTWTRLVDYEHGIDLTKTPTGGQIYGENLAGWRQLRPSAHGRHQWENPMIELQWETLEARYGFELPPEALETANASTWALALLLADPRPPNVDQTPLDFTLVLEDEQGQTAKTTIGAFQNPTPNQHRQFTKSKLLEPRYNSPFEITPETIFLPLSAWITDDGFQWTGSHHLHLQFDQTVSGTLWLGGISLIEQ